MWSPPLPQDPSIDWLIVDPDRGSSIRIGSWINLGAPVDNTLLRSSISQRLIDYYEKLYVTIISEDGFGSSELISDLDYLKDTMEAWMVWRKSQDAYRHYSALRAENNVKEYGSII